jgi:ABC-2 type transport system ATP-binding protein
MTSHAVVELHDVTKVYRRRTALRECTLMIPQGRVVALVGSNGAGKSTMLRIMAGLTAPSSGEVSVLGHTGPLDVASQLSRVGYLDQDRPLYRGFRVGEMLTAAARTNQHWNESLAKDYLAQLGIGLDQRVRHLSGGQNAQVALTLCLATEPELLILDEPAAALDPAARQDLLQLLMQQVSEGDVTVVLSTHALDDVVAICDYLVVVAHGRVVVADDLDFILQSHRLLRATMADEKWPDGAVVIEDRRGTRDGMVLLRLELPVTDEQWELEEPTLDEIVLAYMRRGATVDAQS